MDSKLSDGDPLFRGSSKAGCKPQSSLYENGVAGEAAAYRAPLSDPLETVLAVSEHSPQTRLSANSNLP